jgi:hypothetical protein
MEKIDFVLPWVDGGDPAWLAEKQLFEVKNCDSSLMDDANSDCRYRDDGLLKYWFRSAEKYASWVNRIHFVTCGQKPDWLNESHPKLNLVNHEDFIPSKYLPTFNVNPIEMNLHRIEELEEHFVYFNDDVFLLQPLREDFFFRNGDPVLDTNLRYTSWVGYNNWSRLLFNDYCLVNNSFDIYKSIKDNRKKWFNVKELGFKRARRNLLSFYANYTLPVSPYGHIAFPHLKSSLHEVWDRYPDVMDQTSKHRFRSDDQVNQWLLCAWNQAKGRFYPSRDDLLGKSFSISLDLVETVCGVIEKHSYPQICINDSKDDGNHVLCVQRIKDAFAKILPDKSSFEK